MAKLYLRKNKYYLDYRLNGKRIRKMIGVNLYEANEALEEAKRKIVVNRRYKFNVGFYQCPVCGQLLRHY